MKRVFIILVNWNGWQDTIACLESLLRLNYPDIRIVICDNGSTDDSVHHLKQWAASQKLALQIYERAEAEAGGSATIDQLLTVIRNDLNLGFAGGNNVGLRYSLARVADYFWLLNNDTVVDPDALAHLVTRVEKQPEIGICGSTIRLLENPDKIQALGGGHYCKWLGIPWHYGRFSRWGKHLDFRKAESLMNYVEGASMLVSRRFLDEIGLMCEKYFLYFEEADWAVRAQGRFLLGYAPDSIVFHKVGGSIGTSSNPAQKSHTCDYYNLRNRILFTRKYYPLALTTVWLVVVGELLVRLALGKWSRAKMIFRLLLNCRSSLNGKSCGTTVMP